MASLCDQDGFNAIHYAIRMDKVEYISFLLEADYMAFEG